jgi:DNA-binding transcriptional regulator/RsmH inhibitor MraZ
MKRPIEWSPEVGYTSEGRVRFALPNGETVDATPDEARAFAELLLRAANDCETDPRVRL